MNSTNRPCEPDCQGFADYAAIPCPNPACDDRVKAAWERARRRDRPCDCPAVAHGQHQIGDHEQDCACAQADGHCGCWACLAEGIAYHQVLAVRGGAA